MFRRVTLRNILTTFPTAPVYYCIDLEGAICMCSDKLLDYLNPVERTTDTDI